MSVNDLDKSTKDSSTTSRAGENLADGSDRYADASPADTGADGNFSGLLTLQEASAVLGMSVRTIERSLSGRRGNKLPEGWSACKVKTGDSEEFCLIPPSNFNLHKLGRNLNKSGSAGSVESFKTESSLWQVSNNESGVRNPFSQGRSFADEISSGYRGRLEKSRIRAGKSGTPSTVVIDRSNEVEILLRELLAAQKALAEERRVHLDDLRFVGKLQGQVRLLESSTSESARVKTELELNKQELKELKDEYNRLISLPWWKRLFAFFGKHS